MRPPRHSLTDAAVSQDAKCGARADVEPDQHPRPPDPRLLTANQSVALRDSASGVENQCKCVVCGRAVKDVGGVGDDHARSFGCRHVDVVEPDRDISDHLQLRSSDGKKLGIDTFGQGDDGCRSTWMPASSSARSGGASDPIRTGAPSA